ncbi:MAG: hypothetical protein OEZ06_27385 [Myxococcales bacterium]|nr:hypothetical protein [Myxococcales bacterium]
MRWTGGSRAAGRAALMLAVFALGACAPKAQTVANMSVGLTGCPAEDLAVFNYVPESRQWRAVCHRVFYVCAVTKGGTSCTEQQAATLEAGLPARVQLFMTLPKVKRDRLVTFDLVARSWNEVAHDLVSYDKLSVDQFDRVDELGSLFTEFTADFDRQLKECKGDGAVYPIRFRSDGTVEYAEQLSVCERKLARHGDLEPLRKQPGEDFYIVAGVYGVQIPPEPVAAKPAAAQTFGGEAHAPPYDQTAVRAWIDAAAADLLACSSGEKLLVHVAVDASGHAQVTLRGAQADGPVAGCVASVLPQQTFASGPAEVLHLVKPAEKAE